MPGWGSVARRGVRRLDEPRDGRRRFSEPGEGSASEAWYEAERRARPRPSGAEEIWIDEGVVDEAESAVTRGAQRAPDRQRRDDDRPVEERRSRHAPPEVVEDLRRAVGPVRGQRLGGRLADAARAFERERYQDARRFLRPLADEAPGVAPVRELHGLTLYRLGQYREAARELEAYKELSHEVDEDHVLADCYRALRRFDDVERLWKELAEASPSAELVAEGRIVAAGARADQGDLDGAIRLLEQGQLVSRRPQERHLRMWYVLGDLYEQAGDLARAREVFTRIATVDRGFADVRDRLRSLS